MEYSADMAECMSLWLCVSVCVIVFVLLTQPSYPSHYVTNNGECWVDVSGCLSLFLSVSKSMCLCIYECELLSLGLWFSV